ncbi:MAG: class I SAM-dependent methyltransferase [bacterium]
MMKELFDRLAATYDLDVIESDKENLFPFAGYVRTLDFIAAEIGMRTFPERTKILDLGIGTGWLETKLKPETIELTGIDVSPNMLEIAALRHPGARLFCADFRTGIPVAAAEEKWDVIIATYAMHHLSLAEFIDYIDYLTPRLAPYGRIYIGDILFLDYRERENCRLQNMDSWDETEHYHAYDDIVAKISGKLALSFAKTSFCAGVIIIGKYHDCTVPNEKRQGKTANQRSDFRHRPPQNGRECEKPTESALHDKELLVK